MAVFTSHRAILAMLLVVCPLVIAQDPFVSYNTTIPLGQPGYVSWDITSFAAPVNLWLQQLTPNASAPRVPLDYTNTKGFFTWTAGSNLEPGQYFYQLQLVGGQGIIFKSNPIMIVCSECPISTSSLPPLTSATAPVTGAGTQATAGTSSPGPSSTASSKLSAGAAAGIGVGASLLFVAILGLIFFLLRRSRKRKQERNERTSKFIPSGNQSLTPSSPPPHFFTPYGQSTEAKMGYVEPPLMSLAPQFGEQPGYSHELDSSAKVNSPQISAYQSQSENVTPRRMPSPPSADIAAPQPRSPPPTLTSSRFQYQYPRHPAVSPPIAAHRTPGSNHDSSSYGFPSHEATPNQDVEGFQFQQPHHQGAGSPESQQRLVPRRAVGTPNLRRTN